MGKRADEIGGSDPLDARSPAALPIEPEETLSGAPEVQGAYDPVMASGGLTSTGPPDLDGDARAETEPQAASAEKEEIVIARAEIEETREQMGETIDAIQEKLSPEHLKEQAAESVKQAAVDRAIGLWGTVRRMGTDTTSKVPSAARVAGTKAAQTAQQKPIPMAAVTTSLIALVVGARMVRARRQRPTASPPSNSAATGPALSQAQQAVGRVAAQVQGTAARLASQAQDRMTQRTNPATASQAQQAMGQVAAQVQGAAARLISRARDRLTQRNSERRTQGGTTAPSTPPGLLATNLTVIDLIAGIGVAVALAILRRRRGANG